MLDVTGKWWRPDTMKNIMKKVYRPGNTLVFLDTETTGISEKDEPVQVAMCRFRVGGTDENPELVPDGEMDTYIKPSVPMTDKASSVNGITDAFLSDKPTAWEAFPEIHAFLGEHPMVASYNAGFDIKMMESLYGKNGMSLEPSVVIDVLEMSRDVYANEQSHRLGDIAITLGVDNNDHAHDALADTRCMVRVFGILAREYLGGPCCRTGDEAAAVNSISYFKGRNWKGDSVYIGTSRGTLVYSCFHKAIKAYDAGKDKDRKQADVAKLLMSHIWAYVEMATGRDINTLKDFRGTMRKEDLDAFFNGLRA